MSTSISRLDSSAAAVERVRSPAGMIGAVVLHVGIVAATLFTWSHTLDIADQTPVVPVDLVTLGDKTNVQATVKEEVKAPPAEEAVQAPVPEPAPPAQSSPQEEAAPPDEVAPAPEIKPVPPQPAPKLKPEAEPKKDKFDINNIMALLDKRAPAAASNPNAKTGQRTVKGIGDQTMMTADLKSMLVSMIYKCWSPPVGAPNASDLVVSFRLFLNPDGSVAQPPQLVGNSGNDSYARAAVEAARRAIYTCQPYSLPQDRYAQWRDVTFVFDPRQMVGQ
jgi:outer membrane biosynthesis protein TonB